MKKQQTTCFIRSLKVLVNTDSLWSGHAAVHLDFRQKGSVFECPPAKVDERRTGDIHAMVGFHVRIPGIRQAGNDCSCKRIHLPAQSENFRLQC